MGKQAIENATRLNAFAVDPNDLTIVEDKDHPLYDERSERPITDAFVANIRAKGVLQAVTVRKEGDLVLVVAGRRRVRAARIANEILIKEGEPPIKVPCMVRKGTEEDAADVMISENEHRENDNPLVKARKAARLMARGRSESDLANVFGVTPTTIKNWLTLLETTAAVQKAVETGKISATDAVKKLAPLERSAQNAELKEILDRGESVQEERASARAAGAKPTKTASGSVTKGMLRKVFEAAKVSFDPNGEMEAQDGPPILTIQEIALLGWILGEIPEAEMLKELPALEFVLHPPKKTKREKISKNPPVEATA